MSTTTRKEVINAFADLVSVAREAGITRTVTACDYSVTPPLHYETVLTADNLHLQEGSPTYGRAWRLFLLGPNGAHYEPGTLAEYLGWTKAEAYYSLRAMASGIRATLKGDYVLSLKVLEMTK